jgi:hypothetical protein
LLAVFFVLGLTLGVIFGYRVVTSAYVGNVTQLWINPPLHEASYVVGVYNTTHYYAKNGTTGNYDFLSTNASYVINNAIGKLTGGGTILIKEGTYNCSTYFTSQPNLTLCGQGLGTILRLNDGANCEFFRVEHDGVRVQDLVFDGNVDNQIGGYAAIRINAAVKDLQVENVHFKNMWVAGVKGVGSAGNPIVVGLSVKGCTAEKFRAGTSHIGALVYIDYGEDIQIAHIRCEDMGDISFSIDGVKILHSKHVHIQDVQGYEISGHLVFVGFGSEDAQISDILMHNAAIKGLESVCIEYARDGTDTGTSRNKNVAINNVLQIMEAGGNHGVYVWTADHVTVTNCIVEVLSVELDNPLFCFNYLNDAEISNCIATGYIGDDSSNFIIWNSKKVSLIGCIASDGVEYAWTYPPRSGLNIGLSSEDIVVESCTFKNLTTRGILVSGGLNKRISIRNNLFVDMAMASSGGLEAIRVEANRVDTIEITDNLIAAVDSTRMKGIGFEDGNANIVIKDNDFRGTFYDNIKIWYATVTGLVVKHNLGYVTENSGTATNSTATTFVFNHLLAGTPTGVWASFNITAVSGWTWTATATQITITVTGTLPASMTCYWTAEYKPT